MGSLDYCSHGKRLLKRPQEDCDDCQKIYDTMDALDHAKALVRILDKQLTTLCSQKSKPEGQA